MKQGIVGSELLLEIGTRDIVEDLGFVVDLPFSLLLIVAGQSDHQVRACHTTNRHITPL